MSTQVLFARGIAGADVNNTFLCGRIYNTSSQFTDNDPVPIGGSFGNWALALTVAPGAGASRTMTLHKNGVATALTITISGTATTGTYVGSPVSWAAQDRIRLVYGSTGSPAAAILRSAIEFTPDTPNANIYGWTANIDINLDAVSIPPFHGNLGLASTFAHTCTVALAGTISVHTVRVQIAPGAGTSRVFTLVKNGTLQDGSGGTPDTRVTIADAALIASATFSLSLVAGDTVTVLHTEVGAPSNTSWLSGAIVFTPTIAGAFMAVMTGTNASLLGASEYAYPCDHDHDWSTSPEEFIGGLTPIAINRIQAEISSAPTAGKSWAFFLQKGGIDTSLSTTIADANTTGVGTVAPSVTITFPDRWGLRSVSSGSPGSATNNQRISLGIGLADVAALGWLPSIAEGGSPTPPYSALSSGFTPRVG